MQHQWKPSTGIHVESISKIINISHTGHTYRSLKNVLFISSSSSLSLTPPNTIILFLSTATDIPLRGEGGMPDFFTFSQERVLLLKFIAHMSTYHFRFQSMQLYT